MDYSLALDYDYSEFEWDLTGNTYAGLNWMDGVEPKPTDAECIQAFADYEQWYLDSAYLRNRAKEYISIFELNHIVEALYETIKSRQTDSHTVSQTETDFIADIDVIKAKYPAP